MPAFINKKDDTPESESQVQSPNTQLAPATTANGGGSESSGGTNVQTTKAPVGFTDYGKVFSQNTDINTDRLFDPLNQRTDAIRSNVDNAKSNFFDRAGTTNVFDDEEKDVFRKAVDTGEGLDAAKGFVNATYTGPNRIDNSSYRNAITGIGDELATAKSTEGINRMLAKSGAGAGSGGRRFDSLLYSNDAGYQNNLRNTRQNLASVRGEGQRNEVTAAEFGEQRARDEEQNREMARLFGQDVDAEVQANLDAQVAAMQAQREATRGRFNDIMSGRAIGTQLVGQNHMLTSIPGLENIGKLADAVVRSRYGDDVFNRRVGIRDYVDQVLGGAIDRQTVGDSGDIARFNNVKSIFDSNERLQDLDFIADQYGFRRGDFDADRQNALDDLALADGRFEKQIADEIARINRESGLGAFEQSEGGDYTYNGKQFSEMTDSELTVALEAMALIDDYVKTIPTSTKGKIAKAAAFALPGTTMFNLASRGLSAAMSPSLKTELQSRVQANPNVAGYMLDSLSDNGFAAYNDIMAPSQSDMQAFENDLQYLGPGEYVGPDGNKYTVHPDYSITTDAGGSVTSGPREMFGGRMVGGTRTVVNPDGSTTSYSDTGEIASYDSFSDAADSFGEATGWW